MDLTTDWRRQRKKLMNWQINENLQIQRMDKNTKNEESLGRKRKKRHRQQSKKICKEILAKKLNQLEIEEVQ